MTENNDKGAFKSKKAYKNLEFLNSKDARTIRILAEYLYPKAQLEKEGVQNTIVIFGSARAPSPEELETSKEERGKLAKYYNYTRELTAKLSKWAKALEENEQTYVVCSGGGPGIMMAANRGAHDEDAKNIAFTISLPKENIPNPYATPDLNFEFHYFFTRKFWFSYLAKALIVMPGGFGTLDELFEILTLIQTGKINKKLPIVLFGKDYWQKLINFDVLVEFGTINKKDLDLFFLTSSVDDAFEFITSSLTNK